jgi:tripartite-type tricarboxylate transporter receptor subunit TctC
MLRLVFFHFFTLCLLTPVFAQTPFYQGKTITIIQGRDPGGTGDLRVRALFPFLQKYIPGNPTLVSEYMPGGGGRKAANVIYNSAKPDGLTLANPGVAMVSSAILGDSGILYDINKLHYMGSPYSQYHGLFVTRKEAGLNSIEKLRAAPGVRVGAQSVGFINYNEGRLFAYILGLNEPKFIASYSGPELDAALMRGEIDARSSAADTVAKRNRDWIDKGLVDFHAIIEAPKGDKHPVFSQVPELESFAKTERDRKLVVMSRAFRLSGTPNVAPPNTPKERVAILQEAFRKTFKDPEFARDYKKLTGEDPTPLMPEDNERAISEIPRDPEVVQIFNKLIGAGPLPTR